MVEATVAYEGTLRCRAQHGPSGGEIITDAPKDNQGQGRNFSPTDLVAAAFATCIVTSIAIKAKFMDVPFAEAHARVEKHMSTDSPRRIIAMPVTVSISGSYSEQEKVRLERAARRCPVHHSLHPDIDKPVEIEWNHA